MNDPIADMLTRIKNGYLARNTHVVIPYSKMKETLVKLLEKLGYVNGFTKDEIGTTLSVKLKYEHGVPAMAGVRRLSKPGLRRYIRARDLVQLRRGLGQIVVSTPKGLLTNSEAQKQGVGGELVCAVW